MSINLQKYSINNLKRVLRNPRAALGVLRHWAEVGNIFYHRQCGNRGIDIMNEDWDTLVILDGCRADLFKKHCTINGTFETRTSRGSATPEWIRENFLNGEFHDTVYLTANPFIERLIPDRTFHKVISSLDLDWDDELGTVPPEPLCTRLSDIRSRYPNKRIIAHFIQPHFPFLGDHGQKFDRSRIGKGEGDATPWANLKYGLQDISHSTVRRAYAENLDLALDSLSDILPELPGKTVISSDHGNLWGDRMFPIPARGYGHPIGLHVSSLTTVPWFVIENGGRLEIITEEPENVSGETEEIEKRLKSLGYVS